MYVGYVLVCSTASLKDCVRSKQFACSDENVKTGLEIEVNSVIFMFRADTNTLVGPFTAVGRARTHLQRGTWVETTNNRSLSTNIKVEWEDLHEIKEPENKFPFLRDKKICRLSHFQVQDLLNELKEAPAADLG